MTPGEKMIDLYAPMDAGLPHGWADAYDSLAVGVVISNGKGQVIYANPRASDVFAPLRPVEFGLRTLLGLSGVTGGGELAQAVEAWSPGERMRLGLPDGRIFDASSQPLPDGGSLVTLFDITDHIQSAQLDVSDALTGLATRASFHSHLGELLAKGRRGDAAPFAIHCIDLDKFKVVNDTLGHPVGDGLLVKVAERIRTAVRGDDMIARLGGDEFAVIQTACERPAAEVLASRLVDLVGRSYIVAGHMISIGVSIGVALASEDGDDVTTLLKHADLALYRAKADGRGRFRFFQIGMDSEMQSRRLLEMDLRKALALREFEVFYQPQVDVDTKTLLGFEALLRWRSPARGLVSPGMFMALAEEIGLIGRIGDWVLRTACHEAASWPPPVSISVNISPVQFRDGRLVHAVTSALAASGLDPSRLDLEITEAALLDNTEQVLNVLQEVKALGVRLSMDDFGTGNSSLSYLQKFPFDKIKIDQSFVRGADRSADAGAIVRAVAALGKSLGMTTIAEGVETEEQLDRVRAEGCSEVQGYLIGRPLPAADAASLMSGPYPPQTVRTGR
jgi:diguanylate cyclase (GGDEF)-like protein